MRRQPAWLALAWLLVGGMVAAAETAPNHTLSGSVGIGIRYDSNVAVQDLDESTGRGDLAALLEAGLAWQWRPAGGPRLRAGLEHWQSRRFELEEFDLHINRLSLDASTHLGRTEAGLLLHRADAALGGDRYLVFGQASPYLSRNFGERLVLRLAYTWTEKDFSTDPQRDTRAGTASADAFVLLDGVRHYLLLAARFDDEQAREREFEFSGHRLSGHWIRRVPAGAHELLLRAGLRLEVRRYAEPLLPLERARRDERYRLETRLELPVWGPVTASARYEYAENRSTLSAADFSEHVVALSFEAAF